MNGFGRMKEVDGKRRVLFIETCLACEKGGPDRWQVFCREIGDWIWVRKGLKWEYVGGEVPEECLTEVEY